MTYGSGELIRRPLPAKRSLPLVSLVQCGQRVHELHRLHAYAGDSFDEVDDVAGLFVLAGPVVWVVADAAVLIHGHLVALHEPFEGGLALDDVVVGFQRDAIEGEVGVVMDAGLGLHEKENHLKSSNNLNPTFIEIHRCQHRTWIKRWRLLKSEGKSILR